MTIEQMKQKKIEKGYSNAQISQLSGVALGTVQKIFSGETTRPRHDTLIALEKLFSQMETEVTIKSTYTPKEMTVQDSALHSYGIFQEKGQKECTIEDYFSMSDKRRIELIDGVLYDMTTPTFMHQKIVGEIYRQIANYILEHNGNCEAAMYPINVQLDRDDKTIVQPDVLILCDPDKLYKERVLGAPDFVLEVISPSTKRKDYFKKLEKYENAGVREYWIVDPLKKQVIVFFFEGDMYAQSYDFRQMVSVNIYGRKLQIDFWHINKWCDETYTKE